MPDDLLTAVEAARDFLRTLPTDTPGLREVFEQLLEAITAETVRRAPAGPVFVHLFPREES